jgi:long-chain acyl-CoA synthetase
MMIALDKMTLPAMLENSVEKFARRPALGLIGKEPLTYQDFYEKVKEIAADLQAKGLEKGDKIAILSENMPEWGIAYFAILWFGGIVVPILPDFHANNVQHILHHSGCKAIFISNKQYEKVEDFQFEEMKFIILIENFQEIPPNTAKKNLNDYLQLGQNELNKVRDAAKRLAGLSPKEMEEDDIALIIYTSGTTGNSKGVMLSHKNILFDALETLKIQTVNQYDRLLSILPLSHTYENTIGFIIPLLTGASVFYLDKIPTARVMIPAMQLIKPTMLLSVPLVIEKIYKTRIIPEFNKSPLLKSLYKIPPTRKLLHKLAGKKLLHSFGGKMRFFGVGGAKLSPDTERFLREAKFPYAVGYGLTETSPLIAGCSPAKTRFQSTGFVLPGIAIQIHKDNQQKEEGEIWVKGDNVMKGYYKDPERTKQMFSEDGWFKTGDLGILKDGYLYICGRLKNMIVGPSGENIYPEEVENIINEHDLVLESLVFQSNRQLIAKVHLNSEELDKVFAKQNLDDTQIMQKIEELLQEIKKESNKHLSSFARIQKIIYQPEPFSKTPTKKIKRFEYSE